MGQAPTPGWQKYLDMLREEGEEEDSTWLLCTAPFAHGKHTCSLTRPLLCMPTPGQVPWSTVLLYTVTSCWLSFRASRPISHGTPWQGALMVPSSQAGEKLLQMPGAAGAAGLSAPPPLPPGDCTLGCEDVPGSSQPAGPWLPHRWVSTESGMKTGQSSQSAVPSETRQDKGWVKDCPQLSPWGVDGGWAGQGEWPGECTGGCL